MDFKEPNDQTARWIDFLSSFSFDIVVRRGKSHSNCDGLSRQHPCGGKKCQCEKFDDLRYDPPVVLDTVIKADLAVQVNADGTESSEIDDHSCRVVSCNPAKFDTVSIGSQSVECNEINEVGTRVISINPKWTQAELSHEQEKDSVTGPIIKLLMEHDNHPPWKELSHLSAECLILLQEWSRLKLIEGILHRK